MTWSIGWSWPIFRTGYKQVKITIMRLDTTDQGIFGHLTLDCTNWNCVTLERHDIAIPEGTYKASLYCSPDHNNVQVPLLHGVPGRSFIEIHWGNYEKDSKGCILVGTCRDGNAIDSSQIAFKQLMTFLKDCDDITVTVR